MDIKDYIKASGQDRRVEVTLVCDYPRAVTQDQKRELAAVLDRLTSEGGPLEGFNLSWRTRPVPISADVIAPLTQGLSMRAYSHLEDIMWGTMGESAKYILSDEGPAGGIACMVNEHESRLDELLEFLGIMPGEDTSE